MKQEQSINNHQMQEIYPKIDMSQGKTYAKQCRSYSFSGNSDFLKIVKINLNMNWMKYLDQPLLKDN